MRKRAHGFVMIDLICATAVLAATASLMTIVSISMVRHVDVLAHERQIDAFATGVLERAIAGQGSLGVGETGGDLETPDTWRGRGWPTRARIETAPEGDGLVRVTVVVERSRDEMPMKVARYETVVRRETWEAAR